MPVYKVELVLQGEIDTELTMTELKREIKDLFITTPQLDAVSKLTQNYFDDSLNKYYSQHHKIAKALGGGGVKLKILEGGGCTIDWDL